MCIPANLEKQKLAMQLKSNPIFPNCLYSCLCLLTEIGIFNQTTVTTEFQLRTFEFEHFSIIALFYLLIH